MTGVRVNSRLEKSDFFLKIIGLFAESARSKKNASNRTLIKDDNSVNLSDRALENADFSNPSAFCAPFSWPKQPPWGMLLLQVHQRTFSK
jgi:hypothetical protein